jgi:hypothetical protein
LPLIQDPRSAWEDRLLFTHVGRWKSGSDPDDFQWKDFSVRSQRFRLVNNTELYDMTSDPGQTRNVIELFPDEAAQMRHSYDLWWKETRPLMINESAPLSRVRPFHVLYERQLQNGGIPNWTP